MHNEIVDNNKYLKTLKYLGIDTWELKHNIQNRFFILKIVTHIIPLPTNILIF